VSVSAPWRIGELRRVARFLAVGVLNTAFGYAIFALLVLAGLSPQPSLMIATVLGVSFNFFSFGKLVFSQKSTLGAAGRFGAVYLVSYGMNASMLEVLIARMGLPPLTAQLLCLPAVVALTYLLMRTFVFRTNRA
jgi:putative flippase GtrA